MSSGITHRLTYTFGAGSDLIGKSASVEADSEQNVSVSIPNNTANFALGIDFASAKLQSVIITVSKDCTLEVNDSGTPDQTITLKAACPFSWTRDSGVPYPFVDGDGLPLTITNLYVTVPTTDPVAACALEVRAAVDF